MSAALARSAYFAARARASEAYRSIMDPAAARMAKAMDDARVSDTKVTRAEVTAYVTAMREAVTAADGILAGPVAELEQALAESKEPA